MSEESIFHKVMVKGLPEWFKEPLRLDLGCGRNKFRGTNVGIDISPDVGADLVLDLKYGRLPFADNSVDDIHCSHFLEHLSPQSIMALMNECWRVLKWGDDDKITTTGKFWIEVPHAHCYTAIQDPTHKWAFVQSSFKFFCGDYLKKHALDYPINCIFEEIENKLMYPKGVEPENKKYCTMIHVGLKKSRRHWSEIVNEFPFNKQMTQEGRLQEEFKDIKDKFLLGTNYKTDHNNLFNNELKNIAKRAINKHLKDILRIKIDGTNRYGVNLEPLDADRIFADIERKFIRCKIHYKEGKLTSENIKDTHADGAIYHILALMKEHEEEKRRLIDGE